MKYQESHIAAGLAVEMRLFSDTGKPQFILPVRVASGLLARLAGAEPATQAEGDRLRVELRTGAAFTLIGEYRYTAPITPFLFGLICYHTKERKAMSRDLQRSNRKLAALCAEAGKGGPNA